MNHSCMSAMTPSENSVEKMQVFCPWSSFKMSAWTVPRTVRSTSAAQSSASDGVAGRPRTPARRSSRWSMAVLRNMARMVGAGPLMVIDTDVVGSHRSKPSNRAFMSSNVAIETPDVPIFP